MKLEEEIADTLMEWRSIFSPGAQQCIVDMIVKSWEPPEEDNFSTAIE